MSLHKFTQRVAAGTNFDGSSGKGLFVAHDYLGDVKLVRLDLILGTGASKTYTVSLSTGHGDLTVWSGTSVSATNVIKFDVEVPMVRDEKIKVVTTNCSDELFAVAYFEVDD